MVQQFRRLLEVELTQVALEQVLTRVGVHVAHKVLTMLEGLLTDSTLVRAVSAVGALVVCQVRCLTKALIAGVALIGLLASVHTLMAGEFGQVTESLGAHRALVGPVGSLEGSRGRGAHSCSTTGGLSCGRLLRVGGGRTWPVGLLTNGALHGVVAVLMLIVMLS